MKNDRANSLAVQCNGVCKRFNTAALGYVLHQVSFSVPEGTALTIVGPNGAGKTTLLNLILGLILPEKGTIELLGNPNIDQQRHRTGYLAEVGCLPLMLTGRQYVFHMKHLSGMGRSAFCVEETLEQFDLLDSADVQLSKYSSGMLKKLALATMLSSDPDLLVLDEPMDNLDPQTHRYLADLFQKLRHKGKTLLFSTHHLENLPEYGENIMVMDQGEIAFHGNIKELQGKQEGFSLEFEEENLQPLIAALEHTGVPFEFDMQVIEIQTTDKDVRRKVLELAVNSKLTLKNCRAVRPDLTERYHEIIERVRRSREK